MDLILSLKRIILQLEMRDFGQLMREENNQVKGMMDWNSVQEHGAMGSPSPSPLLQLEPEQNCCSQG